MTPLQMIMTVAKTVSRARVLVSSPPESISVTISEASMTVTASARRSVPNGSPTRSAMTSAWCTAEKTAAIRAAATRPMKVQPSSFPQAIARRPPARTGAARLQTGIPFKLERISSSCSLR